MAEKRVTLRDIAGVSGVHLATVSRVLRNDPQIGIATAKKVRRIAEKMGYKPDPMLTALSSYRSQIRKPEYHATIAWVTNWFSPQGWNNCATFDLYIQGARERSERMGYKLEEFWLRERGLTPSRATSILKNRGISGLIVAPQPRPKMRVRLGWDNFSAVALGYTMAWPQLNMVTNHHFQAMETVVRQVRAHGYRRIGLAVHHRHGWRSNHAWTGAFLALQQFWPAEQQVPVMALEGVLSTRISEWVKKYRLDAVISHDSVASVLETLGFRIPQDIGFATFMGSSEEASSYWAGIDENAYQTGAAAVDLVVGMIHRGERGVPKVRQCLLVEASWREGKTLRFINDPLGGAPRRDKGAGQRARVGVES